MIFLGLTPQITYCLLLIHRLPFTVYRLPLPTPYSLLLTVFPLSSLLLVPNILTPFKLFTKGRIKTGFRKLQHFELVITQANFKNILCFGFHGPVISSNRIGPAPARYLQRNNIIIGNDEWPHSKVMR